MADRTAIILGATGLVGEQCLQALLTSPVYDGVLAVVRKPLEIKDPKLKCLVVDFDKLGDYKAELKGQDVYCAIGTTIAKAGSQAAFRKVDFDYPKQLAEIAVWNGAKRFILVSSMGADANSAIFYSRTKGELEEALKTMSLEALFILRPSILMGDRKEKRPGEAVARFVADKFSFLFAGPLRKYAGTPVDLLGRLMVKLGTGNQKGLHVLENEEILKG